MARSVWSRRSGDIGGAIARRLAAAGSEVVIIVGPSMLHTVNAINQDGGSARMLQLDQRDPAAIDVISQKLVIVMAVSTSW